MRKIRVVSFLITVTFWAGKVNAQIIPVDSVQNYLGQQVTVFGRVADASFNYAKKKDTSIFKLNDIVTGQTLNLLISPEARAAFGYRPENVLLNKVVYIKGIPQKSDQFLQMQISGPFDIAFNPERFTTRASEDAIRQLPPDVIKDFEKESNDAAQSVIVIKESPALEYAKMNLKAVQKLDNPSNAESIPQNNSAIKTQIRGGTKKDSPLKEEEDRSAAQKRADELAAQTQMVNDSKKEAIRKDKEYSEALKKATEIAAQIRKEEEDKKAAVMAEQANIKAQAAKDSLTKEEDNKRAEQKKADELKEKQHDDEQKKEAQRKDEEYKAALKISEAISAKNRKEEDDAKKAELSAQVLKNEKATKDSFLTQEKIRETEQKKAEELAAQKDANQEIQKEENKKDIVVLRDSVYKKAENGSFNPANKKENGRYKRPADKNDFLVGTEIILRSGVSLRGGPGGFFLTIGSLNKGEIVKIISCSFDWCKIARVKTLNGKTIEGYVKADKLM